MPRSGRLRDRPGPARSRRDAASALDAERAAAAAAREELAEMRGRLAVLQEQAELYWSKDDTDR